jgi:hypothetical protein
MNLLKYLALVVGFICLGVAIRSGFKQNHGLMVISFLSFIFLFLFSELDRFSEIKASPSIRGKVNH